jgi:hypothetical protein
VLAAVGFQIASPTAAVTPEFRDAWQDGLRRLSCKDPFAADRQTFAYRPIEVFAIALGAAKLSALDGALAAWLRDVVLRLEREGSKTGWSCLLYEAAVTLLGQKWLAGNILSLPQARPEELALRRWLLGVHMPSVPADEKRRALGDVDAELLRRAIVADLTTGDVAQAAVLHHALRRATHERLESDLACTWQIGRETSDAVQLVTNLCRGFPLFAKQIQVRHKKRSTIEFSDEYDVQDAMHALLRLHFDDVRPEEWTPSYGGKSTRMDFLLKPEQVVVEVKMTRKGLDQKEVVKQLTEDKERYRSHPDCRALVCFVYDPGGMCDNPIALETDVSVLEGEFRVSVVVAPQSI